MGYLFNLSSSNHKPNQTKPNQPHREITLHHPHKTTSSTPDIISYQTSRIPIHFKLSFKASSSIRVVTTVRGNCGSGPNPKIGPFWLIPGGRMKNLGVAPAVALFAPPEPAEDIDAESDVALGASVGLTTGAAIFTAVVGIGDDAAISTAVAGAGEDTMAVLATGVVGSAGCGTLQGVYPHFPATQLPNDPILLFLLKAAASLLGGALPALARLERYVLLSKLFTAGLLENAAEALASACTVLSAENMRRPRLPTRS
jgi:hypothetical protein